MYKPLAVKGWTGSFERRVCDQFFTTPRVKDVPDPARWLGEWKNPVVDENHSTGERWRDAVRSVRGRSDIAVDPLAMGRRGIRKRLLENSRTRFTTCRRSAPGVAKGDGIAGPFETIDETEMAQREDENQQSPQEGQRSVSDSRMCLAFANSSTCSAERGGTRS